MGRQRRVLKQDMTLAFQNVPNIDVPRREGWDNTGFHSLPQPGQELSAKCAACLSYCSKNIQPFNEFSWKNVETPDAPLACVFVPEVYYWKVREDLQKCLVWKFKDCFCINARVLVRPQEKGLTGAGLGDLRESCLHDWGRLGGVDLLGYASSGHWEEKTCSVCGRNSEGTVGRGITDTYMHAGRDGRESFGG